jgi:hypothetical protein
VSAPHAPDGSTRARRVLYTSGNTDDAIVRRGVLDDGIAWVAKPHASLSLWRKVREVPDRPWPSEAAGRSPGPVGAP